MEKIHKTPCMAVCAGMHDGERYLTKTKTEVKLTIEEKQTPQSASSVSSLLSSTDSFICLIQEAIALLWSHKSRV